jgi:hypothetical protein
MYSEMKTCKKEGCVRPAQSHGYCFGHGYLREDKKPKKIAVRSEKHRLNDFSFGFDNQFDLFIQLWENAMDEHGKVICPFTDIDLTPIKKISFERWLGCFAHVLNKKNYTYFKLNPRNIRIVFPLFHTLVDQGTAEQKAEHPDWRFDLWYNDVEAMKIEYAKFKKEHLLA